jgi:Ca-activated chloride channel family protein
MRQTGPMHASEDNRPADHVRTASERWVRSVGVLALVALLAAGCGTGSSSDGSSDDGSSGLGDPGDCQTIDIATSSEKIDLMTALAKSFNGSADAKVGKACVFARPYSKASGAVTDLLANGWPDQSEGPKPVIWSPASTSWGGILTQRLRAKGEKSLVSAKPVSFQLTPLVIAMPKPMADALGYPGTPVGWADIARLATSPDGWAAYGHPEWGAFKLGKTNPNFSTSGLSALIGQAYAATGKTRDLSLEDLDAPATEQLATQVESAVVHYGDITQTFLNNWYRTDRAGTSLLYASALAVEEKSVVDYNTGNPDGVLEPGEKPRRPRVPLVAIYPKEGTVYSDNPLYVLDAPWVSSVQRTGAQAFIAMVQRPQNQRKVLSFGFRPGNPDVAVGAPITKANGLDPNQPAKLLQVPEPKVLIGLLNKWRDQRKGARVELVLDVSGSMSDSASDDANGDTKLDLAKRAAIDALDEFKDDDEVGFRIFTTGLGGDGKGLYQDVVPIGPMSANRELMKRKIGEQIPLNGTPLYVATQDAFQSVAASYDPARINAVVLLTDGVNEDGNPSDDRQQLQTLLSTLQRGTQGENAKPVRVFTIAYGRQADQDTLKQIAEASNAAAYDASKPETIAKVFTAVVSNF